RNPARIHKWSDLQVEQSLAINILVGFPVGQKIAASYKTTTLPAVASRNVTAHPQITVPIQAQHEELIEGDIASSLACAYPVLDFIVVALGQREPVQPERWLYFEKRMSRLRPYASGLRRQAAFERDSPF